MDRSNPRPRTSRLLTPALLVALTLPLLSAVAAPSTGAPTAQPTTGPAIASATGTGAVDQLDVDDFELSELDLDQMPFLDADGEYDAAGDAAMVEDPLPPELVVMGGDDHHAHDAAPHDDEHAASTDGQVSPATAAAAPGGSLPATRRPLACEPNGGFRTVVVYTHLRRKDDRRGQHLGTIRSTVERSNQLVAASARDSGGPAADLRTACTSGGAVSVATASVTSTDFGEIKRQLADQGFDARHEKYLVFADFAYGSSDVAGLADLYHDTRRSVHNHNNGNHAMYAVVYGSRYFSGATAMHELAHTMGAVQRGAPGADDGGHCTTTGDLLCRGGASEPVLDRGNDTYFSTATRSGEWLHHNWNLGWEGNRFVDVAGRPGSNLDPTAELEVSCTRATCVLDGRGSHDPDGQIVTWSLDTGDGQPRSARVVRHSYPGNGTYEAALTVTDDRGATSTVTHSVRIRDAEAPLARGKATCDGRSCTFDATGSTDPDGGSIVAYRWRLPDERTSARQLWKATFDEPGRHRVELTVTDDDGWTSTTSVTAHVRSGDVVRDTAGADVAERIPDLELETPGLGEVTDGEPGIGVGLDGTKVDLGLDDGDPTLGVDLGGGRRDLLG